MAGVDDCTVVGGLVCVVGLDDCIMLEGGGGRE